MTTRRKKTKAELERMLENGTLTTHEDKLQYLMKVRGWSRRDAEYHLQGPPITVRDGKKIHYD
ncbi:MAG: hypothetical protein IPM49_07090 [Flavobacteriales bacterium]|nr:hypothetical protein [Flavobacteriales bacterium]